MSARAGRMAHVPGQMLLPLDVPVLTDAQRAELAAHIVPGWQAMGECRSTALAGNADQWFPDTDSTGLAGHAGSSEATEIALDACRWCPVRRSCLASALSETSSDDDYGIWGGTTESQRDGLRQTIATGEPISDVIDTTGGLTASPVAALADVA